MDKLPSGEYFLYLRKSRADLEAEQRGEGETLAKHRKALYKLAKHHKLNITETFEEIASGESLYHRPEMLRLLEAVDTRNPKGVLVMDMDRLGRGNMQEQGLILGKFRDNNVLIVTPRKIYDLNNEFDEEYSEFEAFMARKELKIITRRLQSGRIRSVEEGNFIQGPTAYGYKAAYTERGERYLIPHEEQAEIVKLIFEWYTRGIIEDGKHIEMGSLKIAKRLQSMGVQTSKNRKWDRVTIIQILRNEVYIGRIQFKKRSIKKRNPLEKGSKYINKINDREQWIDVEGKHDPIIDEETFRKANAKLDQRQTTSLRESFQLVNPLAGILVCGKCGFSLSVRTDKRNKNKIRRFVKCNNAHCDNRASNLEFVEHRVLQAIELFIKDLKVNLGKRKVESSKKVLESVIKSLHTELGQLESQKMSLFDFLERKIYDEATFLERSRLLTERIKETNQRIKKAEKDLSEEEERERTRKDIIPESQNVLKLYRATTDVQKKNALLKSILVKVEYTKELNQKNDEFTIAITPKIVGIM